MFYFVVLLVVLSTALVDSTAFESHEICPRIRRAWHLISTEDKSLYVEGILALRNSADPELDPLYVLGDIHRKLYVSSVLHQSSANFFWHGYLLWELESRIRSLGGKFSCFGMPYYDYTIDYNRESHSSIIQDGILGGDGDPQNYYKVNDYSWDAVSTQDWFVPNFCFADDDEYPLCSLKRKISNSEKDGTIIPSATDQLPFFIQTNYSNFMNFSKHYQFDRANPLMFLSDSIPYCTAANVHQGFDPIWWLMHSFVQYQLSLWISCRGNDGEISKLKDNTNAYTAYCGGKITNLKDTDDCANGDSKKLRRKLGIKYLKKYNFNFSLDAPLHFLGLEEYEWSFVHRNTITVRKMYDISKWNVKYDVGSFYYQSTLNEYCAENLNKQWFIDVDDGAQYTVPVLNKQHKNGIFFVVEIVGTLLLLALLLLLISYAVYHLYRCKKWTKETRNYENFNYHSVSVGDYDLNLQI